MKYLALILIIVFSLHSMVDTMVVIGNNNIDMELVGEYNITATDTNWHSIAVLNASDIYVVNINGSYNGDFNLLFSPDNGFDSNYYFGLGYNSGPPSLTYIMLNRGSQVLKNINYKTSGKFNATIIIDFSTNIANATIYSEGYNVNYIHVLGIYEPWPDSINFSIDYYGNINATIKVYKAFKSATETIVTKTITTTVTNTSYTTTNTYLCNSNYTSTKMNITRYNYMWMLVGGLVLVLFVLVVVGVNARYRSKRF